MSDEKKIIIDDDWKSQVAAEKEALKEETTAEEPAAGDPATPQMPPASFEMLVTTLATEAMVALGQFPNPATQEISLSLDHAGYAIDMLSMLEEKTKGNRTSEEDEMMTQLLHQLRMMFVQVQQTPPPSV